MDQRPIGLSKITVVGCNFKPSKSTVVEHNFGPSKVTVVDRNFGPSHKRKDKKIIVLRPNGQHISVNLTMRVIGPSPPPHPKVYESPE